MANLFPKKHSKEKKLKNVEDVVHILWQTCFQKNILKRKNLKMLKMQTSHAYIALIISSSINYNMLH